MQTEPQAEMTVRASCSVHSKYNCMQFNQAAKHLQCSNQHFLLSMT